MPVPIIVYRGCLIYWRGVRGVGSMPPLCVYKLILAMKGGLRKHNLNLKICWFVEVKCGCSYGKRNYKNVEKYIAAVKKGRAPVNFREKLSDQQRAEERLLLSLRLSEGVDYHFVKDVINKEVLDELKEQGFVTKKLNNIVLTDKGFLVADEVIVKLLRK